MGHKRVVWGSLFTHKLVSSLGSLWHEVGNPGSLVVDDCGGERHCAYCGAVQRPGTGMDLREAEAVSSQGFPTNFIFLIFPHLSASHTPHSVL